MAAAGRGCTFSLPSPSLLMSALRPTQEPCTCPRSLNNTSRTANSTGPYSSRMRSPAASLDCAPPKAPRSPRTA